MGSGHSYLQNMPSTQGVASKFLAVVTSPIVAPQEQLVEELETNLQNLATITVGYPYKIEHYDYPVKVPKEVKVYVPICKPCGGSDAKKALLNLIQKSQTPAETTIVSLPTYIEVPVPVEVKVPYMVDCPCPNGNASTPTKLYI